eukprot:CAMPEP_0201510472 /NCGR_PEP_ID=MMETSP0161_2-20130828/3144_1 /ASSEMBLY_ACC=CAM_ASM_000251 /TAXON_ID=180227 /ORGANISM="Neoparamoeba aestuarina, Strain SoJaBio B1-5/56/2" /LENGTH=764 /DNA_ID=CAMNT_0047905645 /DNA_START=32 /DNA_END=2326 /DNA_ORIENTATION=-
MCRHYTKKLQHINNRNLVQKGVGRYQGCLTIRGEAVIFSSPVIVKQGLGKTSGRLLAISRSFVALLKAKEKGGGYEVVFDANEKKGEILELSNVEGVSYDSKRIRIKGKEGDKLDFKWDLGNVELLENAIGGALKVNITTPKKNRKGGSIITKTTRTQAPGSSASPTPSTLGSSASPSMDAAYGDFLRSGTSSVFQTSSLSDTSSSEPGVSAEELDEADSASTKSPLVFSQPSPSLPGTSPNLSRGGWGFEGDGEGSARTLFGTRGQFGFTDEDLANLKKNSSKVEKIRPNQIILEAGSLNHELIVVLGGDYVAVLKEKDDNKEEKEEKEKRVVLNNVFIGEISFMLECPSTASIYAGSKGCKILRVPYSVIICLSRFDSLFLCRLYQSFLLQLWKRLKSHDSQQIGEIQKKAEPKFLVTQENGKTSSDPEIHKSKKSESETKEKKKRSPRSKSPSKKSQMVKSQDMSAGDLFIHEKPDAHKKHRLRASPRAGSWDLSNADSKKEKKDSKSLGDEEREKLLSSFADPAGDLGLYFPGPPGDFKRSTTFSPTSPKSFCLSSDEINDLSNFLSQSNPAAGFMEYVDEEVAEQQKHGFASIQRSIVVNFQLEEMTYASKLSELREWKDHKMKKVNKFTVVDDLYKLHSKLVEASCSNSVLEIIKAFENTQWRAAYTAYFSHYPSMIKNLFEFSLTVLELDRIFTLLSLPLKRLSDYSILFRNLSVLTRQEENLVGEGWRKAEISERLGELTVAIEACQRAMLEKYES